MRGITPAVSERGGEEVSKLGFVKKKKRMRKKKKKGSLGQKRWRRKKGRSDKSRTAQTGRPTRPGKRVGQGGNVTES